MKILSTLLPGAVLIADSASSTATSHPEPSKDTVMHLQSAYPVVVTDKLAECRDFYVGRLGFRVVFEATWFVYLESAGDHSYAIAFMTPDHPSRPPGPEAFDGKGLFLTLQVADAAAEFERLTQAGVAIAYPLADEPWGQRRFGLFDPAGLWVDVVEQTEPAPGFWEPYMTPAD